MRAPSTLSYGKPCVLVVQESGPKETRVQGKDGITVVCSISGTKRIEPALVGTCPWALGQRNVGDVSVP